MYALIVPSGCGKTTALKIFMGIIKPDSGHISRMGDYKYPTLQSAYVSQEGHLKLKKDAIWNVRKVHRTASTLLFWMNHFGGWKRKKRNEPFSIFWKRGEEGLYCWQPEKRRI